MQNVLAPAVGAFMLIGALLGFGGLVGTPLNSETIRIGFIGPLTGDGAAWGGIELNSIRLAVDEINKSGGVNGRTIEIIAEDGKCEGAAAVSAAQKLINVDKVKILLVSCSQEVLPIAPIAEQNKVLVFASYATASTITSAGDYVFRNAWLNGDMSKELAKLAIHSGTRSAVISQQSEFSLDLRNLFVEAYKTAGGVVTADEEFPQGSEDVRTQVAKAIASKPDSIVLDPNGPGAGIALLKELRAQGYTGKVIGNFFGSSSEVQAASAAKGMTYVADPSVANTAEKQAFIAEYKSRFGTVPSLEWPAVARYDAVHILANAMREVGDDPTKIKDYLYAMPAYAGLAGTYSFDSNGDAVGIKPTVDEINN